MLRRRLAVGGLLLVGLITLGAILAVLLARSTPSWWQPAKADDPAVRSTADALENGVVNQLHAARASENPGTDPKAGSWKSEAWTVTLQASDANAWLAASLPKWLANQQRPVQLPPAISELQIAFAEGVMRVGARVDAGGSRHMLSASVRPEVREDGSLWLAATWVRVGRMPVPASWLLDQAVDEKGALASSLPKSPEVVAAARVLAGLEPASKNPELKLADGRRVRLLKIEPHEGQLWLTCRTEGRQ